MGKNGFSSRIGVVLAAAGGAVGLGNIWKFPYMLGQNGGGAFLLVYLICVSLFGLPLIMTEFMIGKRTGKSVFGAFATFIGNKHWNWLPVVTFFSTLLISGFYYVVTSWCIYYFGFSIVGIFESVDMSSSGQFFASFIDNGWAPSLCCLIAVVLTAAILWIGVGPGIERLSKILMPLLLIILLVLIVRVSMLEGAYKGVTFLFTSDVSKITPHTVLDAMGQCFYSLSIGMGILITYGAYMPKNQNVMATTVQIIVIDTLVAILAGCAIFPAVFALGFSPVEGPRLVFEVLPMIFNQMAGGPVWSTLFFALLSIAAITSAMSLVEMLTASLVDWTSTSKHPKTRHQAIVLSSVLCLLLALLFAWSMSSKGADYLVWHGKNAFDWADQITSTITLPIIAMSTVVFLGWFVDRETIESEIKMYHGVRPWYAPYFRFLIRWFIPVIIFLIFLNGVGAL